MPLLNTSKAEAAKDYWTRSRHLQALKTPAEKAVFADMVLQTELDDEPQQFRRQLLSRLIERARPQAA